MGIIILTKSALDTLRVPVIASRQYVKLQQAEVTKNSCLPDVLPVALREVPGLGNFLNRFISYRALARRRA